MLMLTILLFILYVIIMKLKNWSETLSGWRKYVVLAVGYSLAVPGYIFDLWFNFFIGSIIFWQKPDKWIQTLTSRLENIIKYDPVSTWRYKLAYFICRYLLHPHDKGHCGKLREI